MLVPRVIFNESNVGVQPITTNVRNRIGMVGQFSRGPANTFSFIDGYTDFANRYGSDSNTGSIAFQAAYDMGAREFGLVRVLGSAKLATGNFLVGGIASKNNILYINYKFVGDVVARYGTVFQTPIETSGSYTGATTGRYFFRVDDITGPVATVKYVFKDLQTFPTVLLGEADIDWPSVTDSISVNLTTDDGIAKTALGLNGVSVTFGQVGTDIVLSEGQVFTVRVSSYVFPIDIIAGTNATQIVNDIVSTLQGVEPLGLVSAVSNFSNSGSGSYTETITFELDENLGFAGSIGNKLSYYTNLQEPDGLVRLTAAYDGNPTPNPTVITTTDVNAEFIEVGAIVTSTSVGLVTSPTEVVSVTESLGTYTITLDTPLVTALDGTAIFEFSNQAGITVTRYTVANTAFFSGGVDGPRNAQLNLFSYTSVPLIRLFAVSSGAWGNGLKATILPLGATSWRVTITDTQGATFNPPVDSESFVIDLTQADSLGPNGEILALQASNLIRGIFLPKQDNPLAFNVNLLTQVPQRVAAANALVTDVEDQEHPSFFGPANLKSISFEDGYDGPRVVEADWVKAIKVLEGTRCHIICAPGIYTNMPFAQATLISVAENSSELEGLKIAILSAKPGLVPSSAAAETLGLSSVRGVMIAGWSTYAGQPNAPRFSLSPDALYAGSLSSTSYFVSPAARTTAGSIPSIIEVDTTRYNSLSSLQLYTDARLDVIALDSALSAYYFVNGRTLSASPAWDKVVVRRTYDVVRQDLYESLQQYKSEPHTKLLRKQIVTAINAYFATMARNSRIANYRSAICDESNNKPENYVTGELNVEIYFLPLYSADYISVSIIRTTSAGLVVGEE